MYAIRDIPGKGKGLVATRDIARGTRILYEEPLLRMKSPRRSEDLISTGKVKCFCPSPKVLDPQKRPELLALHNPHAHIPSMKYLGVIKANGLTLRHPFPIENYASGGGSSTKNVADGSDRPGPEEVGIFILASRINHDCNSNAHGNWSEEAKHYAVHASRDINLGDEITVDYAGPFVVPNRRREMLLEKYDFACTCRLCSLSASMTRQHVKDMLQVHERSDSIVGDFNGTRFLLGIPPIRLGGCEDSIRVFVGGISKMLANIDMNVRIYEKYGMDAAMAISLSLAATICSLYGDLSRCSVFWEWAAREWKVLEGEDSPRYIHSCTQALNPRRYRKASKLKMWATEAGDVPWEVEEGGLEAFENWLWGRTAQPTEPGDDGASEQEDRHVNKKRKTETYSDDKKEQEDSHVNKKRKTEKYSDDAKEHSSSAGEDRQQEVLTTPHDSQKLPASGEVPGEDDSGFYFYENDNEEDEDFRPDGSESESDPDA